MFRIETSFEGHPNSNPIKKHGLLSVRILNVSSKTFFRFGKISVQGSFFLVFLHSKAKVEVKICILFKRRQAMTSSLRVEAEIINKIPFRQSGLVPLRLSLVYYLGLLKFPLILSDETLWFVPKGVIFDALYMVEGEVQGLQVRVGLTVEGATQEHVQLVVL